MPGVPTGRRSLRAPGRAAQSGIRPSPVNSRPASSKLRSAAAGSRRSRRSSSSPTGVAVARARSPAAPRSAAAKSSSLPPSTSAHDGVLELVQARGVVVVRAGTGPRRRCGRSCLPALRPAAPACRVGRGRPALGLAGGDLRRPGGRGAQFALHLGELVVDRGLAGELLELAVDVVFAGCRAR